ncbi:MAG: hypothetical protein HN509_10440 [Halobacteriovoraceae bacterium]|jgi:NADH-quinone oxidoreductase subunit N|nr:hypothetical protein [Halobacteriovoraceae bacterium]
MEYSFLKPLLYFLGILFLGLISEAFGHNGKKISYYINLLANTILFAFFITSSQFSLSASFALEGITLKTSQILVFFNLALCLYNGPSVQKSSKSVLVTSFLLLAGMLVLGSQNFMTFFISSELLLVLFTVTISLSEFSNGKIIAFRYFIQSSIFTILLCLSGAFILASTQSLSFQEITVVNQELYALGIVFLIIVAAFRIGVFPFHHWVSEVYSSLGNVGIASALLIKRVVFSIAFINLIQKFLPELTTNFQLVIINTVSAISILSILYGGLLAFTQDNPRKSIAFTVVSLSGLVILGGLFSSSVVSSDKMLFLVLSSSLCATGVFWVFNQVLQEDAEFSDLRHLFFSKKFEASLLCIFLMSLVGLPFTIGFQSKFLIFLSYLQENFLGAFLVGALSCLLGLILIYKFLSVVFDKPSVQLPGLPSIINLRDHSIQFIFLLIVVIIGVVPSFFFY